MDTSSLPLKRVVLFSSGVGYFEHAGSVEGDARVELKFSVDDASGLTVIKVIDTETQEIVRQIPPEEVLTLMHHLENLNPSLMMDVKA